MDQVNIHEAKTHLSRLLERVAAGEEIVIAKAGKPMARLTPVNSPVPSKRPLGIARDTVKLKKGWDKPITLEEMIGK